MIIKQTNENNMISNKAIEFLQDRIKQEETSSWLYLSMAMWLDNNGFTGAASLYKKYSIEEKTHADWSREYLLNLGITPCTPSLEEQPCEYDSFPYIIRATLEHEVDITNQIKEIASFAMKEADFMLFSLTNKYLAEQNEELGRSQTWVDKITSFGEDKIVQYELDKEMGNI